MESFIGWHSFTAKKFWVPEVHCTACIPAALIFLSFLIVTRKKNRKSNVRLLETLPLIQYEGTVKQVRRMKVHILINIPWLYYDRQDNFKCYFVQYSFKTFYPEQLLNIVSDRTPSPTRADIDSESEFLNFKGVQESIPGN